MSAPPLMMRFFAPYLSMLGGIVDLEAEFDHWENRRKRDGFTRPGQSARRKYRKRVAYIGSLQRGRAHSKGRRG